jgi:flagellar biosynthetic protein FliR
VSLSALNSWLVASLLVSLRIAPVFSLAPPFTLTRVPLMFRVFFGLGVAGLCTAMRPAAAGLELSAGGLAAAGLGELLIGTVVAAAFHLMFGALYLAGRTIDIQAGFGLATVLDPSNRSQQPLIGTLFAYAAGAVFFAAGGPADLLKMLSASLDVLPAGGGLPHLSLARLAEFTSTVFIIGLGAGGASILALFLTDALIALMSRTLPQMNVLMLGIQVKTVVLLTILPLSVGVWGAVLARLSRYTLDAIPRLL